MSLHRDVTAPYAVVRLVGLGIPGDHDAVQDSFDDTEWRREWNGYTGSVVPGQHVDDDEVQVEFCRQEDSASYLVPCHRNYLRLVCAHCEEGRHLRNCNNCGMSYCSRAHQEQDWEIHKLHCSNVALARAAWLEPRPPADDNASGDTPKVPEDIYDDKAADDPATPEDDIQGPVDIGPKAGDLMDNSLDKFKEAVDEAGAGMNASAESLRTKALDLIRADKVEDALDVLSEAETLFRKADAGIDELHCMYEYSHALGLLGRDDESAAVASIVSARARERAVVDGVYDKYEHVKVACYSCLLCAAKFQVAIVTRRLVDLCSRRHIFGMSRVWRFKQRDSWTKEERDKFNHDLHNHVPSSFRTPTDVLHDVAIRVLSGRAQHHWDPVTASQAAQTLIDYHTSVGTIAHAEGLIDLGIALADRTDVVRARSSLEHAVAILRKSSERIDLLVLALRKLGGFLRDIGDRKGAKRALREAKDVLVRAPAAMRMWSPRRGYKKTAAQVLDDVKKDLAALKAFERESTDRCLRFGVGDHVFVNKMTFRAMESDKNNESYDISDNRDDLGLPVRRGLVVALWPEMTWGVCVAGYEVVLDDTGAGGWVFFNLSSDSLLSTDSPCQIFRFRPEMPQHQRPRFPVGTRVLANCGEEGHLPGTVVQLYHATFHYQSGFHSTFQDDVNYPYVSPYQIRLDDGQLICAPEDNDDTVRALPAKPGRRHRRRRRGPPQPST